VSVSDIASVIKEYFNTTRLGGAILRKIKLITIVSLMLLSLFLGGCFAAITVTTQGFDPHKLDSNTDPTIIKDGSGQDIIKIQPPGAQDAPISAIPLNLQHAVISIEDSRFYQNNGIDFRALVRSLSVDILNRSAVQGASTIPEQLAKVVYLSDEKTLSRKIKQLFYGIYIEKDFSKDQILDFYLNRIYFGHGATGVTEATRVYFNKPVSELTLVESALIASLPKAPSYYDPYVHESAALDRRNTVLQKMLEQKYITDAQYEAAIHEPIKLTPGHIVKNDIPLSYQYYRDYLYEEADSLGISVSSIANGGLTVYTSMNPTLQEAAYNMYQDSRYFPEDMSGQMVQRGAAFMDPKTGGIEAIIGGRGTYVSRGLDHATQIHRSPGSSIKPTKRKG
jgi:penicillin-binding protein 2A